ncbi:MAG: hypothetical protein M1812_003520 [Candelaria pacifica]|nr:MAG: hypothetical protein M1812_003520 [Candelaria pacifica]
MSLFDNVGGPMSSSLPANMSGLGGDDSTMTDMLDQDAGIMNGLDIDMLPVNLDLSLNDPDPQTYAPIHTAANQQQQNDDTADASAAPNSSMTGAGAGPLPTGFGNAASVNGGSTLTEFTKRRNWSQRVLEELKDFLHILTPDGRILYVSPSSKALTSYDQEELVGKFIVDFIHPDDSGVFVREFNESIASGNALRFFYRFRKGDGTYTIFESHGHPHLTSEAAAFGPNNAAGFCRGFFMMARPFPTKNAQLLDSFLEHKIENERLTKRIADLKREEQEEAEHQQRHWMKKQEGHGSVTPSDTQPTESETLDTASSTIHSSDYNAMPPPAKPTTSNTALTRQNLDEANASSKNETINDKMARYEGATHIETIEMLTGLRYRDGERSQGISTGDASPALIRGDAGIAIPVDKDTRAGGDKKKKLKVADEYVCTDCGTLDSPEWRKGPNGPKTLCNACGLRWAKKEKKRHVTGPPPPGLPMQLSTGSG